MQCIHLLRSAQSLSEQTGNKLYIAQTLLRLSKKHDSSGYPLVELSYMSDANPLLEQIKDITSMFGCLQEIGYLHFIQGDLSQALTGSLWTWEIAPDSAWLS